MKIMRPMYNPFVMGGDCYFNGYIEVPDPKTVVEVRGQRIALIEGPDNKKVVVEMTSGATVGPSLDEVIKDIEAASSTTEMELQVIFAIEQMKNAQPVKSADFWRGL